MEKFKLRTLFDVRVKMRDGITLSADIYLPKAISPFPCILYRTPYNKASRGLIDRVIYFGSRGYAVICQDVRGRGDSDGIWVPGKNETEDGYDTIEWIAKQKWCTGKIGTTGGSYGGLWQWFLLRELPPHLTCMAPVSTAGDFMHLMPYLNGIPLLEDLMWQQYVGGKAVQMESLQAIDWQHVLFHLPIITMDQEMGRKLPLWREELSHPMWDEYWEKRSLLDEHFANVDIPILHISGWHDDSMINTMIFYRKVRELSKENDLQYLVLGPWNHAGTRLPTQKLRGVDFGPESLLDIMKLHLDWFDYWLKGNSEALKKWPKTRYFEMITNRWVDYDSYWPPKEAKELSFFLSSKGLANGMDGDGYLSIAEPENTGKDTLIYDPINPVMDYVDFNLYGEKFEGPFDKTYLLKQKELLVYTSDAIDKDLKICGTPTINFYGSSDCTDTDWFATWAVIHPEGEMQSFGPANFGMTGIRARYRESIREGAFLIPYEIYPFKITLDHISVYIKKKSRLILGISSSAFPTWARNTNTGNSIPWDTEVKIAHNSIHFGKEHPSKFNLPVLFSPSNGSQQGEKK